ncbi:sporulation protein YpjB [Oceanobacillus rekensis]|uniref:sporulation protein YpjB n=1 Tax=Oceanobacillus rekensis TaxID=937927 RepID=UPI000B444BB7|nr:sporulation protein YpjB [Oceanobacillus rekensis]
MVNRRKLLVQITTTVFIGILFYLGFGSFSVEASTVTNVDLSDKKVDLSLLIWTIFIVGGSIIGTLSYVSWKKYNAELKTKKEERKDKSVD